MLYTPYEEGFDSKMWSGSWRSSLSTIPCTSLPSEFYGSGRVGEDGGRRRVERRRMGGGRGRKVERREGRGGKRKEDGRRERKRKYVNEPV